MTFFEKPTHSAFYMVGNKIIFVSFLASLRDVTPDYKSPDHDERLMEEKRGFNTRNEHLMGKGQR